MKIVIYSEFSHWKWWFSIGYILTEVGFSRWSLTEEPGRIWRRRIKNSTFLFVLSCDCHGDWQSRYINGIGQLQIYYIRYICMYHNTYIYNIIYTYNKLNIYIIWSIYYNTYIYILLLYYIYIWMWIETWYSTLK